jgi:RNA binding exosome subunit
MPICADDARGVEKEILARATGDLDEVKMTPLAPQGGLDDATVASGLREALAVATGEALTEVSRVDGYFGNQAIKILMPERMQKVAETLTMLGFQKEVEGFVLSMNRAAEHAAPNAAPFFFQVVKEMKFDDANRVLKGGDTAATEYLKEKSYSKLYEAFKPEVLASMNEAGVPGAYKALREKYQSVPFMKPVSLDLDQYVTEKSLDGIFTMAGQAEKSIRTDPAAQVTPLLKKVFGRRGF